MDREVNVDQAMTDIKPEVRLPNSFINARGTEVSYYSG